MEQPWPRVIEWDVTGREYSVPRCAFRSELQRHGFADAGASAGYKGDSVFKRGHRGCSPGFGLLFRDIFMFEFGEARPRADFIHAHKT